MWKTLCSLSLALVLLAGGQASARTPILPVEQLQAGMKGYAKTVVTGDTIETFPVEVLGVTGNDTQGYQILIRAGGDVIERSGGISQGMSGSPVYINGRLAGAVAFGKAFNDPHYCFLQPIETMLRMLNPVVPRRGLPSSLPASTAEAGSVPAGTPLLAGGFSPLALEKLNRDLGTSGLTVFDAGASGSQRPIGNLEPGSAVGVALMTGDLTLGAIGTVTWTDEQGRVLAFGHPFLQRGDADFFLTKAWILTSLPNIQTSYKVGTVGESVGTVTQDRSAGVAGKVGPLPASIPVFVQAADMDRSENGSVRVQVVDDPQLAPDLIAAAVTSTVSQVADTAAGGSGRVEFDVEASDSQEKPLRIVRQNMFYSTDKLTDTLPEELKECLNVLMRNKLENVSIRSVDVKVDMSTESLVAEVQSASVREKHPRAGDTIHIDVVLKPYRSGDMVRTVEYSLPADAEGTVRLRVSGGAAMNWIQELIRNQKESGIPVAGSKEDGTSGKEQDKQKQEEEKKRKIRLRDYVREVNKAVRNNDIIVEYAVQGAASRSAGDEAGQGTGLTAMLAGGPHRQVTPVDYIVDGETAVSVKVKGAE